MQAPDTPPPAQDKTASSEATCLTPRQIAHWLHDAPLQSLSAARLLLLVVQNQLPKEGDLRKHLKQVDDLLDETCTELTALMKELRTAPEQDTAGAAGMRCEEEELFPVQ